MTSAYNGWRIDYSAHRPITGQWRAERFGITEQAVSYDALIVLLDQRADLVLAEAHAALSTPPPESTDG